MNTLNSKIFLTLIFSVTTLFYTFFQATVVTASGIEKDYMEAVRLYNSRDYDKAVSLFERIADLPVVNGELYYNLGNVYYKKGDIGKSILWYERALKQIPGDPDLQFNHHYVSELVVDKIESTHEPFVDALMFWRNSLTLRDSVFISVALTLTFCCLSILRLFKSRRWMKYGERMMLFMSLMFVASALHEYYSAHFLKQAIVISKEVSVRSGLGDESTELFILHSGSKVNIEDAMRGYVKIRFSGDKVGWLEAKNIEQIDMVH